MAGDYLVEGKLRIMILNSVKKFAYNKEVKFNEPLIKFEFNKKTYKTIDMRNIKKTQYNPVFDLNTYKVN